MTVKELVDFLSQYDSECKVHMLQCSDDNPLYDDVGIKKAIAIEDSVEITYIVLIPE